MEKVTLPEGVLGKARVEYFDISERDASWAAIREGWRAPLPGRYTRIYVNGVLMMSDTRAEMLDRREPVENAKGHILIHGLGLGLVLHNSMLKNEVDRATVIEISQDVIDLVGPHYTEMYGDRIEFICADAMTWKPPKNIKYGMVWHDIWPNICADNYSQMKTLHRRYGGKCDWQGSWCRSQIEHLIKQSKRERYW